MIMLHMLLAAAAAAVAPAGSADLASEQQVLRVEYGDLDLNSPGGRADLQRRLEHAAWAACDEGSGPKRQDEMQLISTCKQRARAGAALEYQRAIGTAVAARASERPKF